MSDRQDTPDAVLPGHRPDRPIATASDDTLGRGEFVRRLARALVTPGGRASGVVIGLTGPWGSGKSSTLNLLEAEIKKVHPGAVVVRFDPWLVSGRDDVITQFFAELLATIKEVTGQKGRDWKKIKETVHKLSGYAKDLAPAAGLLSVVPAIGLAAAGTAAAAGAAAKTMEAATAARTTSLASQHKELRALLTDVAMPIVVLIDELDRVEDAEVRAVAQLVRAVADFPGISYLLAYDRDRVVEALGGGATAEKEARGNAYLEKIELVPISRTVLRPQYAWFRFILCCQSDPGQCALTGFCQGRESHRTGERSISQWSPPYGRCA
jgi:predicted KAP-like P-loop ATPase